MKKFSFLLFLCFSFGFAQNKKPVSYVTPLGIKEEVPNNNTTVAAVTTLICPSSVVPPTTINGVAVTDEHTGDVGLYSPSYPICLGPESMPPNTIYLGQNGPFTYTLHFSQPVNNLVIAISGSGVVDSLQNENFIFGTNGGVPSIVAITSCFTTINGNIILSGSGATSTNSDGGGGGIFTITAPNNFTSLVISGNGGLYGSILSLCSSSVQPVSPCAIVAPVLNTPTLCGVSTVNLNAITSTNLPTGTGISLAWFSGTPATSANQLTATQATSQPLNTTYYAAFYDSVNACYGATTGYNPINTVPITPSFSIPNAICYGDTITPFPVLSNDGISGSWLPVVNNTDTTTYTFTPNANQCALSTTFQLTVNKRPVVHIDSGCNGKDFEIVAVSDITSNVTYQWYDAANTLLSSDASLVLTQSGVYHLVVTNVTCSGTATINAINIFCGIQKGISPNNDGLNDFFELSNLNVNSLSIFNRYGVKVYAKADYKNEWIGNANNGNTLPDGVYYYSIDFKSGDNKTGWIYLNRDN